MTSDTQKRAESKYARSEKGKATNARYAQSKKGKIAKSRGAVHHARTAKGKITDARKHACYAQTEKGKITEARHQAKRKEFGFEMINDWFEGCEGHHIDKENVLFIPAELHKSIRHSQGDPKSMREMNDAAFEWFYIEEVI